MSVTKTFNYWLSNIGLWFIGVSLWLFLAFLSIVMCKNALGIYKLEREVHQIKQELEEKAPIDKIPVQNSPEKG